MPFLCSLQSFTVFPVCAVCDCLRAAVVAGMKYQIPALIKHSGGKGSIVNFSSVLGIVGWRSIAAYCASKHAVIGLTRAAALENSTQGVRVNAVCPGYVDTPLLSEISEQNKKALASRHPMSECFFAFSF